MKHCAAPESPLSHSVTCFRKPLGFCPETDIGSEAATSLVTESRFGILCDHKMEISYHKYFCLFKVRNGCNTSYENTPGPASGLKWSYELQEASQAWNTFSAHQSSVSIAQNSCGQSLIGIEAGQNYGNRTIKRGFSNI